MVRSAGAAPTTPLLKARYSAVELRAQKSLERQSRIKLESSSWQQEILSHCTIDA